MATPTPRSMQQNLGDMLDAFLARHGANDLRVGSVILAFLEAAAQNDFRVSKDIFAVLDAYSIDRATGEVLDRLANDNDVYRFVASAATGSVTFVDSGMTKIATKIYPGTSAPNAGSITINVADALLFPDTGRIYLGRGTSNLEGPISYSSKILIGSYWQLGLDTGTTKFHNLSESVILAQGNNRTIGAGTIVQTPQNNVVDSVQFRTTIVAMISDGETTIENVPVIATVPGTAGNVARYAISEIISSPLPNLTVNNILPFVTGQDQESDIDLRARIKKAIQSRGRGTALAIESGVLGITSVDEPKRVLSSKVVETPGYATKLVIDDGSGYEESTQGVGFVSLIDIALGGEQFLQLPHRATSKANLITNTEMPFGLQDGDVLAVLVGGVRSEHTFDTEDFKSINNATSFEVASSINSNPGALFSAATVSGGSQIRIFSKTDDNEDLQIVVPSTGNDANDTLQFNDFRTFTLNLYKNDVLLYKDGVIPKLFSAAQSTWDVSIVSGDTLEIRIDGTEVITNPVGPVLNTYTFYDADFVAADTGYTTVSPSNSLEAWAAVLNYKIPGITVSVYNNVLMLQSNKGAQNTASLEILGGTLVAKGVFPVSIESSSFGRASDYSFNRNTGQITLTDPLVANDNVTLGSRYTRAYLQSDDIITGTLSFSADANLWLAVDGDTQNVVIDIPTAADLDVTNPIGNIWRYSVVGVATSFVNVAIGDWVIVWDPSITDSNNLGYWRIAQVGVDGGGNAYIEVERSAGTVALYTLGLAGAVPGITVIRNTQSIQQIIITGPAVKTVTDIVTEMNTQLIGAVASVVENDNIRITTLSYSTDGSIALLDMDSEAQKMLFTKEIVENRISHTAFIESQNSQYGTPLFVHDVIATGDLTVPPTAIVSTTDLSGIMNPNSLIGMLRPFGTDLYSSNHFKYAQLENISAVNLNLDSNNNLTEILDSDRFFAATPFDFDGNDNLVTVIDDDAINKTFAISLFRNLAVKSDVAVPLVTAFDVYDTDLGPTSTLDETFGDTFNFNNYKVWMKARNLLNPTNNKNAIVYRAGDWGPNGNQYRIGYFYPVAPSAALASSVTVGAYVSIDIVLPSDALKTLSHDGTTEFDITVAGAGPFVVTYTHNGVGPVPDFAANGVVIGDIITFNSTSFNANNNGTWRITGVGADYVDITRSATGTVENNVPLNVDTAMQVYAIDSASSIASEIVDYVNTNLSNYITAELTEEDPVGTPNDGSGIVNRSTEDDLGYTGVQYVNFVDGENWILDTDLTISPHLTLKQALAFADALYFPTMFSDETMRLIPVTAQQLSEYLNVLGTSGITTSANVSTSALNSKLQIYTSTLGDAGSVQIAGGTGNVTVASVIGSGVVIDTNYTAIRINATLKRGFHRGQFVQVESTAIQPKVLGFSPTTALRVTSGATNVIDITAGTGVFQLLRVDDSDGTTVYQVEKQGDYLCIVHCDGTAPDYDGQIPGDKLLEGDWVTLGTGFSVANQGVFQVIRQYQDSIYIENPDGIEEITAAGASMVFVSYDSVMPGDEFIISSNILGVDNQGQFTVVAVNSDVQIEVDGVMVNNGPTVLGDAFNQIHILEQTPFRALKRIHAIAINATYSSQLDIILEGNVLASKISSVVGSYLTARNKLNFVTKKQVGIDGCKRYIGLINEANKIVYGDPINPATYPGIKAAGAQLNIEGPIIKRIQVALSVRVRTGVPFNTVQEQVRSEVASVVNNVAVGTSVVISDLITAAGAVDGVLAVSVISPTYNSSNDLISVQSFEKPLIIDPGTDITVSQIGE